MRGPSKKGMKVKMTGTLKRAKAYFVFLAVLMVCGMYVVYKWQYPGNVFKLPFNETHLFNAKAREFFSVEAMLKQSGTTFEKLMKEELKVKPGTYAQNILDMIKGNGTIGGKKWGQIDMKARDEELARLTEYFTTRAMINMSLVKLENATVDSDRLFEAKELEFSTGRLEWPDTTPDLQASSHPASDSITMIHTLPHTDDNVNKKDDVDSKEIKPGVDRLKAGSKGHRQNRPQHHAFDNSRGPTGSVPLVEGGRADSCVGCFPNDFPELLSNRELCDGEVDVLIAITSSWDKFWARRSIRRTWGEVCNKPDSKIKCAFFFGQKNFPSEPKALQQESEEFKDIVKFGFVDAYSNLTYKTLSALKWATKYCPNAKYVMKTDDDMYINTELLPYVIEGAPDKKFIGGHCWGASHPHRDRNSKWYVSFQQYSHPSFPAMCSGTGYIMSRDLVQDIVDISENIPFFHLEDVYVAICVKRLGAKPFMLSGFRNEAVEFEKCNYRNRVITSHGYAGPSLDSVWRESRTCPLRDDLSVETVYFAKPM